MRLKFQIHGTPVEFRRNWFTGTSVLVTSNGIVRLQRASNPLTHISFKLTRTWVATVGGAEVRIQKTRPLFLAGLRPQRYEIFVDESPVTDRVGY
jgi:hypothetical protein